MSKIKNWTQIIGSAVGGWWSLMSGAISIPFAFIALISGGKPGIWFAILAYATLWVLVIRMAYANHQRTDKASTKKILGIYFKAIDDKIELLKIYRRAGGRENYENAANMLIEGGELCVEISEFIKKRIGPIEATIFSAKSDCIKSVKMDETSDFWEISIEFLTGKLIKLKEIMNKQL